MGDTCRGEGKGKEGRHEGGREGGKCMCMYERDKIVDLHAQSVKEREAGEGDGGRGRRGGREGEGEEDGESVRERERQENGERINGIQPLTLHRTVAMNSSLAGDTQKNTDM